jgi:hypothetical protein
MRTSLRRILVLIPVALLFAGVGDALAYPWPIKPFNKQHPVRGNFGDPRTVFQLPPGEDGLNGPGGFSFHNGVDISCPPGTAVYPVRSGTARIKADSTVVVSAPNRPAFHYVHITPAVFDGQHVLAKRTVLGYVQAWAGHVHLTELDHGHVVNPLAPGHLSPYRDTIRPTIASISVHDERGQEISPLGLSGRVQLTAEAYDLSSVPVPGPWFNLPVSPAFVAWRLERLATETLAVPTTVTADFRESEPSNRAFWRVYARGTYQNMPRFASEIFTSMPGRYVYNLTPGLLDTQTLANGVYVLWVLAVDVRGNWTSASQRISIFNDSGLHRSRVDTGP